MANLKGSTFEKQIKDALIRIDARGTKRTGDARFDGLAHSNAVLEKRKQILEDFTRFLNGEGFIEKLNSAMTPEIIAKFLQERTAMMALVTIENYIANFSALIKALRLKNITINENADYEFFQREKDKLGRPDSNVFQTGRYMDEDAVQGILDQLPHRSHVVAIIQYKLCFRASEALLIANNPNKYLLALTLSGVKGKGGQFYPEKTVDQDIANLIRSAVPISRSTYYRDQRKALCGKNRPHDLRLTHICDLYDSLRDAGEPHEQSMLKASKASNHHRPSTTGGYQARR
ncbi:MAG TPA: hypothetical protein PLM93_11900 [Sulfuricurvum sp.]|nr:MAG: hypothetical protein B7Y30_11610 [Campylobacterales bacterium 16-40-21]OZA02037.1 MAG: hypothetical protein B7X89_10970 [Sulfuricurvum sp. 17-40-25]HQS67879.1 hypothetical protein [Sulfuricurvum sp.]HQT37279.1 hypothetical protein [Sulfuricurvum sp.]